MNCPVCDQVRMREVDKEGVTVDICPQCKGVWLDRGELEKLLSGVREVRDDFNQWHQQHRQPKYDDDDHEKHDGRSYDPHYKKHKKKSFLDRFGDIFD